MLSAYSEELLQTNWIFPSGTLELMKVTQLLVMDMEVAGMVFFLPANYHCQFPSGDFSFINEKINK